MAQVHWDIVGAPNKEASAGHADASLAVSSDGGLPRSSALRGGIHGVKRLARSHEQTVALGATEADVAAHFGQADPADELAVRRPYRYAAIAHMTPGIA